MSGEQDRVLRVSDLAAVEAKLAQLENRVIEEVATNREHVEKRITEEAATTRERFEHVEKRISEEAATNREYVEKRITEEAVTTRRHFDIMAENVAASVRLVAEVAAHHSTVLDDHETRLKTIEKRRA